MMESIRKSLKKIPILGKILADINRYRNRLSNDAYSDSISYWETRYAAGGNSGSGSYQHLAAFKAKVINEFIAENNVGSAIEFGCGDGNQLSLIDYKNYIGLDVSKSAIQLCTSRFSGNNTRSFFLYDPNSFLDNHQLFQAELSLSLDVLYHIIEETQFEKYIADVINAASRYVIIYSSNFDAPQLHHVKNRHFTKYIDHNFTSIELIQRIENPFKYSEEDEENTSTADFYIFRKKLMSNN